MDAARSGADHRRVVPHGRTALDDGEILQLGRLAVGLEYCSFADVKQAAMQHAANPGSSFAEVLVERGAVTAEQLGRLLLLQAEEADGEQA